MRGLIAIFCLTLAAQGALHAQLPDDAFDGPSEELAPETPDTITPGDNPSTEPATPTETTPPPTETTPPATDPTTPAETTPPADPTNPPATTEPTTPPSEPTDAVTPPGIPSEPKTETPPGTTDTSVTAPPPAKPTSPPATTSIGTKTPTSPWRKYFAYGRDSGVSAGLSLGTYMPSSELLGSGMGVQLFGEWRQTRFLSGLLSLATGIYGAKDVTLSMQNEAGETYTLAFDSKTHSLGWLQFGVGVRGYYPWKYKITPGLGLFLTYNSLSGQSFSAKKGIGFAFDLIGWYEIIKRLEVGLSFMMHFWSFDRLVAGGSFQEQFPELQSDPNLTLSKSESASDIKLQLSVRYRVF